MEKKSKSESSETTDDDGELWPLPLVPWGTDIGNYLCISMYMPFLMNNNISSF